MLILLPISAITILSVKTASRFPHNYEYNKCIFISGGAALVNAEEHRYQEE